MIKPCGFRHQFRHHVACLACEVWGYLPYGSLCRSCRSATQLPCLWRRLGNAGGRNAAGLVISLGFHLIYIFFQEAQWSFALRPISCSMNSKNKIRPAIFVRSQLQCPHHMQWHACVCMCLRNLLVVQLLHWWPVGHKWPEKEHELLLCTSLADTPSTQPCSSCQIGPCVS